MSAQVAAVGLLVVSSRGHVTSIFRRSPQAVRSIERFLAHAIVTAGSMLIAQSAIFPQRTSVPVVEIEAPSSTSSHSFAGIFSVRELPGGRLLVNDGVSRQVVLLDGQLRFSSVTLDSVSEKGNSYGSRPSPLVAYLHDSTLFIDGSSSSILVIDQAGVVARAMAAPNSRDLVYMASSATAVDEDGNLLYKISAPRTPLSTLAGGTRPVPQEADSAVIVRANLDTRRIDTIARVRTARPGMVTTRADASGTMRRRIVINPLTSVDEWAVLSDGRLAIVRGFDYHVEVLASTGLRTTFPKLPFDFRRVSDAEKQQLLDSARQEIAAQDARLRAAAAAAASKDPGMASGSGISGGQGTAGAPALPPPPGVVITSERQLPLLIEDAPLNEIADYYPPFRSGAVTSDVEDNLWILPTISVQSRFGELVYDVVNQAGVMVKRVRLSPGRSIAGFGSNGILYLRYQGTNGRWFVERTRATTKASN